MNPGVQVDGQSEVALLTAKLAKSQSELEASQQELEQARISLGLSTPLIATSDSLLHWMIRA